MQELTVRAEETTLDAPLVAAALERHFPRFPGDHMTVLHPQPGRSFLDYLDDLLAATPEPPVA